MGLVLFILLALNPIRHPARADIRWNNRAQTTIEFDSNVYESHRNTLPDLSLRQSVELQARLRLSPLRLRLDYLGAAQVYRRQHADNKLINDGGASIMWRPRRWIALGGRASGRLKVFLRSPWDYFLGGYASWLDLLGTRVRVEAGRSILDYEVSDRYDYSSGYAGIRLSSPLRPGLNANARFERRMVRFERSATTRTEEDVALFEPEQQEDRMTVFQAGLDYRGRLHLRGVYNYTRNRSNSDGFSWDTHRLELVLALPISRDNLLIAYLGFRQRHYRDDLLPIFPSVLDQDREANNFLLLEFSRPLNDQFGLVLRLGGYRNESPFPNRFYNKVLLSVAVESRL